MYPTQVNYIGIPIIRQQKIINEVKFLDSLSTRIKYLRNSLAMNQSTFASLIAISQASLSDIEKGKTNPSVNTLKKISEQFGVTTDWLLKGDYRIDSEYMGSEVVKKVFDIIPNQLLKNKNEITEKFDLSNKLVNKMYNIYFFKLYYPSLTQEEKELIGKLKKLSVYDKKEILNITNAIIKTQDQLKNSTNKENKSS